MAEPHINCGEEGPGRPERPQHPSTASELLQSAIDRDPQAWRDLVKQYSPLLYRWCLNADLRSEDAADVVQTILLDVALALSRFKKDGKRGAYRRWLRTITKHKIADFYRTVAKQLQAAGNVAENFPDRAHQGTADSSSESGERKSSRQRFWRLIDQVEDETDETTWQAFWLTTVDCWTADEAGVELDMTANAVRLSKARVLRRLREALGPESEEALLRSLTGRCAFSASKPNECGKNSADAAEFSTTRADSDH